MTSELKSLPRIDWESSKVVLTDKEGNFQEFYLPDCTRGALILFFERAGYCYTTAWDLARATLASWKARDEQ